MRFKVSLLLASILAATSGGAIALTDVPNPNTKTPGVPVASILSPELLQIIVASGAMKLENPSALTSYYGYDNDVPNLVALPGDTQTATHNVEASKTEPDKNTYLVAGQQTGPDTKYDYGTHFLYQGHELGTTDAATGLKQGYITRINLDADGAHRITLLADKDVNGNSLPVFDGSTWDPFAFRLLFTAENGNKGGVWQATVDYPSTVEDISGALGRGGYEGIQNDSDGNLWVVEDAGGKNGTVNKNAKQPNSFVYRFIPKNTSSLTEGKLQVLQVQSKQHQGPIQFNSADPDTDILSVDVKDLHTYGQSFDTSWITIHDTDTDGNTPYDANALAKAKGGTAFKRPENGVFRPGTGFTEFYFTETGDTNANTEAGADYGGFGAVFKLTQASPSAGSGTLTIFYKCDVAHSGFDNIQFWSKNKLLVVEDAGDTLHTQRNALDSGYAFNVTVDYSSGAQPIRFLAEGRDASATIDSALSGSPGFQNDGDNEITGMHVSNGDATVNGVLGAQNPTPGKDGWRVFYTQQHGDNNTFEIVKRSGNK